MAASIGNTFVTTGYTADNGDIYKIRIANKSRGAQSTADPGNDPNTPGRAMVGGSRRKAGLHARGVRLVRRTGTAPNLTTFYTFLPLLLQTDYAALAVGAKILINGVQWIVESHVPEVFR